MASSSLPAPEPPPLDTRAMFRLFVLAMIAGVGMWINEPPATIETSTSPQTTQAA